MTIVMKRGRKYKIDKEDKGYKEEKTNVTKRKRKTRVTKKKKIIATKKNIKLRKRRLMQKGNIILNYEENFKSKVLHY